MAKPTEKPISTLIDQIRAISDEIDQASNELEQLVAHANRIEALQKAVSESLGKRSAQVAVTLDKLKPGTSQANIVEKLRQIDESASTVYLKLQMKMQNENRLFASVSNILKTRHDTVKNAIGNIR